MTSFQISVKDDIARLKRRLDELQQRKLPIITAIALTKAAQDVKAAEVETMARVFDRPTRFTLNSLRVQPATATSLISRVFFRDTNDRGGAPAWKYLRVQVRGGARRHKSFELRLIRAGLMKRDEFAVPGLGAPLNASGNVSGSLIERVLSQLQAAEQFAGFDANETARSRKRNKPKNTGRYFVLRPEFIGQDARLGRDVTPGIYWRKGLREIVPFMLFVRASRYAKRFPYFEVARRVFRERFPVRFREEFERKKR